MSVLTILVGSPGSDRAQVAHEWRDEQEVLSLADLRRDLFGDPNARDRADEFGHALRERLTALFQTGRPVVIDDTNRTPKDRRALVELAKRHGYRAEAVFFNLTLEEALQNVRAAGNSISEAALRKFERSLQVPTLAEGFDRIEVRTSEAVDKEAAAFFHTHEERLVGDPVTLIRELEQDGRLQRWLPELHLAIPIDQHSPHHRFTIYEHIMKATGVMAGSTRKMVWTMLLHDIGKAYPGIKQFTGRLNEDFGPFHKRDRVLIENGADIREGRDPGDFYKVQGVQVPKNLITTSLDGHFYEHENLGAQMAFRVLTRFGYPHDFALEVSSLIQFHMVMPRDEELDDPQEMRRFYSKVGGYAGDLMWVRFADDRGK